ncbi:hypothetical protein BDQ12DRAFT_669921 [Crucibulum laeve]|uniref:Uncharacterized protein n=1 Tax=Crucibulum laeve TaxID=68775 RepID=A0A5C3LMA5_9AGAR|nr:hypothetical protein BDQ12DRAFT_669921 [Crucibulum laeve]
MPHEQSLQPFAPPRASSNITQPFHTSIHPHHSDSSTSLLHTYTNYSLPLQSPMSSTGHPSPALPALEHTTNSGTSYTHTATFGDQQPSARKRFSNYGLGKLSDNVNDPYIASEGKCGSDDSDGDLSEGVISNAEVADNLLCVTQKKTECAAAAKAKEVVGHGKSKRSSKRSEARPRK